MADPTTPLAKLAARIGKPEATVQDAYDEAKELIDEALVGAQRPVPQSKYDRWLVRVGYACWDSAKSSNGTKQVTTMEGQVPVRSPRDLLAVIRADLANYVVQIG